MSDDDYTPHCEEKSDEEILTEKIITYYGYYEENFLKSIAKTSVKLLISEKFKELCYGTFEFPDFEGMKIWVVEEMKQNFDDKVLPLIEETFPDLDDEGLDLKIIELEKQYEIHHQQQLDSIVKATLKELKVCVRELQKDLKTLKRKYTI